MFNAQVKQDVFVNKILQKNEGFFLDIGAGTGGLTGRPVEFYSNTYFFERYRGWKGIAIDYDENWYNHVKNKRTCKVSCVDLLEVNINQHLSSLDCPDAIDYISLDVDDAQLKVFNEFDWDKYRFKVLTLEHNLFQSQDIELQSHDDEHKEKIKKEYDHYRQVLRGQGYEILYADVVLDGYGPVEDWWVDKEIYEKYKSYKTKNINYKEVENANFIFGTL